MTRTERAVKIGGVTIGGGHPVAIQSMLCCALEDVDGNIAQAKALEQAGCEIVRVTVPNAQGVKLLSALKENISIPVVADIHYDYKMALESVAAGADKIRLNPGNLSSPEQVKLVANACANAGIPIRVGANSGSV
ncbi:MAG: flavodoxin-dependent (E)-4-hydroxy-3-methylbut-2-enyl-diphosphate synthase, partial [Oscillospiraceae bacterium]|nr:flavodoxin-dependent (E)-4-hydroxy-3-methylbut-2-enyl-diphosphate synthase [Oscillospiraceae bacterium]